MNHPNNFSQKMIAKIHQGPRWFDALALSVFVIFITFQPYYRHGAINLFEVGLYLPGINAILHDLVPFRDFFHLRGPFELYIPAGLMRVFGANIDVLYLYFYIGTILALIACVWLGKELYRTKYLLYLMVPVLVARTFPRVVFSYWGGLRYAVGLLALFCAIRFFNRNKLIWIYLAGVLTAVGFFTSIEIGVCAGFGIILGLCSLLIFSILERKRSIKSILIFAAGILMIVIPYGLYLSFSGSFMAFVESVYMVVAHKMDVINPHLVSIYPSNFKEAFLAMINPSSENFQHMTPAYLYIILFIYLVLKVKNKTFNKLHACLVCIAAYGIVLYIVATQNILAQQFEMALQPEKILLFFLIEEGYLSLAKKKKQFLRVAGSYSPFGGENTAVYLKLYFILFLFLALFMSSVNYSIARYNHRFFVFKYIASLIKGKDLNDLKPWLRVPSKPLEITRARNVIVPLDQAMELETIGDFINRNTKQGEVVFMYPEIGTYSFLFDRPFLGRFPIATFSWFDEKWHQELLSDFKRLMPRYIILQHKMQVNWEKVYFANEKSKRKYQDVLDIIQKNYSKVLETPYCYIYKLKAS